MMKIKFGIIGAGVLAPLHAKAIQSNPRAMLVGIADIDHQKADKLAKEYDIEKVFTDYEDLLLEPVDVVCICVPSGLHSAIAVRCAAMGKHVLTEKPLDITFDHMDKMIIACRNAGVKLGTVFQRRTLPHVLAAKKVLDTGGIGQLMMIQAYLKYFRSDDYYASAGWRGKWELDGGGALMNQGIHGVDLLQWIGGEIESVMAYTATLARKNIEVEDTAVAIVKFKNGALGTVQSATSVYPEQETSIEMNGDEGTIKVNDTGLEVWEVDNHTAKQPSTIPSDYDGHAVIIEDMIGAVIDDREPMITGVEGRKSVELILAIYESARLGREVKLSEFHPFSGFANME